MFVISSDVQDVMKKRKMLVPAKLELLPEIMRCKRCSHVLSMHKVFVDSEDISYQHAKCHYKKCRRDGPLLLQWGMKKQVTVVGKYRTSSTYPDIRTGRKTPPLWVVINISRGLGTENQRDYGNAIVESFAAADMPICGISCSTVLAYNEAHNFET